MVKSAVCHGCLGLRFVQGVPCDINCADSSEAVVPVIVLCWLGFD